MGAVVNERIDRWLRFLAGGAVNTAFSYAVYFFLNMFLSYQWAYFLAYIIGVFFAYWLNARWVFRVQLSWKGFFSYPIIYVLQYLISALFLGVLVEVFGISVNIAPIYVVVALLPITYLMNWFFLNTKSKTKAMTAP